jgi:septal ring factor EnvC (AmiA/AmiB activator)
MNFYLALGLLLTLPALFYIFYLPGRLYLGPRKTRLSYLRERKEAVYENLRDLNFEYLAGKVPDADYQQMKRSLQDEAATILAEISRLEERAAAARAARERA